MTIKRIKIALLKEGIILSVNFRMADAVIPSLQFFRRVYFGVCLGYGIRNGKKDRREDADA